VDVFEQRSNSWKITRRVAVPDQRITFEVPGATDQSRPLVSAARDRSDVLFQLRREFGLE
jgi:hypothetical protein